MPISGLVAYEDDALSDHEDHPSSSRLSSTLGTSTAIAKSNFDGDQLNVRVPASSDNLGRSLSTPSSSKPAVIIRRHPPAKPHPRSRLPDDVNDQPSPATPPSAADHSQAQDIPGETATDETSDELTRIRQLLRPPPIPGVQDWGIPPEPSGPCDEAIRAKVAKFLEYKRDPENPQHFNDSLMSNRTFRNPHLYAQLVEFVDVDERTTNFPKDIWDPMNMKEEWFADRIAEAQKARSEATSAAQHSSKRARIDFTSSSTSSRQTVQPPNNKHGRSQPYNAITRGGTHRSAGEGGVLGGGYRKGRESRWG